MLAYKVEEISTCRKEIKKLQFLNYTLRKLKLQDTKLPKATTPFFLPHTCFSSKLLTLNISRIL